MKEKCGDERLLSNLGPCYSKSFFVVLVYQLFMYDGNKVEFYYGDVLVENSIHLRYQRNTHLLFLFQ